MYFLLAHLSRRLIGELIGYSWSGVCRRRSQCSKIFFSKIAWPIKAKFYVEPPWVGGTNICLRHLGHMTKMAATPIYGKNTSLFFLQNWQAEFHKTWYVASGLQPIIVCSNDNPGVTLSYFTSRSNLVRPKKCLVSGWVGGGGQGRCEQRSEKKMAGGGSRWGGMVDVKREVKFL